MANTDRPNGFRPVEGYWAGDVPAIAHAWPVAASQTIAEGDPVALDSAGRVTIAVENSTAALLGVSAQVSASAAVGTDILVYDNPNQVFEGQCSGDGALADPYTCATSTSCFDIDGTTGIFEIDENASSQDLIQVIGVGWDPATGARSAVGTNQRKLFKINRAKHQLNTN